MFLLELRKISDELLRPIVGASRSDYSAKYFVNVLNVANRLVAQKALAYSVESVDGILEILENFGASPPKTITGIYL